MKTSHQFARELLALPDVEVALVDPDTGLCNEPHAHHVEGYTVDGSDDREIVEIYGEEPVVGWIEEPSAGHSAEPAGQAGVFPLARVADGAVSGLLPCPFCGLTDKDSVSPDMCMVPAVAMHSYPESPGCRVECEGCGTMGPLRKDAPSAQQAWNTRQSQ